MTRWYSETSASQYAHGFSEMSARASGWLSCLAAAPGPWLMIVANYTYRLLASEDEGSRRPFDELLAHHGYALEVKEPVFPDAALRNFMGVTDYFFLLRRRETKTGLAVASHILS